MQTLHARYTSKSTKYLNKQLTKLTRMGGGGGGGGLWVGVGVWGWGWGGEGTILVKK